MPKASKIAVELIAQLAAIPGVSGAHVMAPNNEKALPEVLEQASQTRAAPGEKAGHRRREHGFRGRLTNGKIKMAPRESFETFNGCKIRMMRGGQGRAAPVSPRRARR